jgi:hypothetical protein
MSSQTLAHMKKDVKAFSEDSGRRRREESAVQLRKTKKEESLNKKRNITLSAVEEAPEAGAVAAVPEELNIKLLPSYVEGEHCVHVLRGPRKRLWPCEDRVRRMRECRAAPDASRNSVVVARISA